MLEREIWVVAAIGSEALTVEHCEPIEQVATIANAKPPSNMPINEPTNS